MVPGLEMPPCCISELREHVEIGVAFQREGGNNIAPGDYAWHRQWLGWGDLRWEGVPHASSPLPQLTLFNALAVLPDHTCCDLTTWRPKVLG